MLRLNYMLKNRFFRKVGRDKLGREWWSRIDANVYRYHDKKDPSKRFIQIDRIRNKHIVSSETYELDSEAAYYAVAALHVPTTHIAIATGPTTEPTIPLEDITGRAMSAFDRWYAMVAEDPDRDIAGDVLTLGFGETEFKIPLYFVDVCEATSKYLHELHRICIENNM